LLTIPCYIKIWSLLETEFG